MLRLARRAVTVAVLAAVCAPSAQAAAVTPVVSPVQLIHPAEGSTVPAGEPITIEYTGGGEWFSNPQAGLHRVVVDGTVSAGPQTPSPPGHTPASLTVTIPALAPGPHTLQLQVTTMGDLAAWYERHEPMPANCRADGQIIALICEYRSQDLTLTVADPVRCTVPKVAKGTTLRVATSRLRSAHCALGTVSKVRSRVRRGRTVSLGARAGRHYPSGHKVAVRISRGR